MIRFRHRGCQSEVIRYVGQAPTVTGIAMKSAEWQFPDCRHPKQGEPVSCPDCGKLVPLNSHGMEPITQAEPAEA